MMKEFENSALFWQKLDTIYLSSKLVVHRAKDSAHPKYRNLIYPVNYGILEDTGGDGLREIRVFKGSMSKGIQGIIVGADILKRDCEAKLVVGCTEEEIEAILMMLNQTEHQKTVLLRRGNEVPEWASNS
ncbi:inorganic pyrophosphatase [Breznakia blatticola]|uniref:Inorganic pyrophosphatase n=2 Tax=Breznakia TaxID=1854458 RepID=A0A4R8A5T2_9FIRM|nr:inorganic pyrophosphatase [Breznakia sp. PH1-1]MDH6405057.1 inorganic pyrophosphatase [Breznakia sp. PF1-11]MDH6412774.1 inorganic pyrophosphatase [Breznakia sp. PFB1-11]MDH6415132.1 inorganic pyrophosphatase [Breznakia sp. PFB1-14]MDH6417445.1 inorganic pyrophosphatase [Breznakia sp. PFB1-4]MDH6419805.1 inorganic pyrophosphatase [Breznakia sp. PFB1-12]MDH6474874.1 inorganic pyrophosphatase [Breznakia sp. PFB2-30]MDH6477184.1 inorganic pyrophosphatase [Breznakia sp. PFB1-19]TDW26009.1 in